MEAVLFFSGTLVIAVAFLVYALYVGKHSKNEAHN